MQFIHDTNQLCDDEQGSSRIIEFRVWMIRHKVTYSQLAKDIGSITGPAVIKMLKSDRISSQRHQQFISLGIPEHLLPPAIDVPRGRRRKSE